QIPMWSVRNASDSGAGNINTKPIQVTIEQMIAFERPSELPNGRPRANTTRYPPVETSIYVMEARLIAYRFFDSGNLSGDLRLILEGTSGEKMGSNIPKDDPEFVPPNSRFAERIAAARSAFRKHFNIPASEEGVSSGYVK